MKKVLCTITLCLLTLMTVACQPPEKTARDMSAGLKGLIEAAQAQYQVTCTATPSQAVCKDINKGVQAQNLLITSLETYCGWSTTAPPPDVTATCVPVKSATTGLNAAIANANALMQELKGIIAATPPTTTPVPATPTPTGGRS